MDGNLLSVSPDELYAHLGTASAPMLVDVRRQEAFSADDKLIIGRSIVLPKTWTAGWMNCRMVGRLWPTVVMDVRSARVWRGGCGPRASRPLTWKEVSPP